MRRLRAAPAPTLVSGTRSRPATADHDSPRRSRLVPRRDHGRARPRRPADAARCRRARARRARCAGARVGVAGRARLRHLPRPGPARRVDRDQDGAGVGRSRRSGAARLPRGLPRRSARCEAGDDHAGRDGGPRQGRACSRGACPDALPGLARRRAVRGVACRPRRGAARGHAVSRGGMCGLPFAAGRRGARDRARRLGAARPAGEEVRPRESEAVPGGAAPGSPVGAHAGLRVVAA